ncbi:MAG: MgtC/SapB family protein [Fluviicola sp.]|jgi:putative Mg2+ transporter-C (MgtC) family protein|uniref:MgtC/SapB family protein n=1 Tax=Fluviicola sp. TaxID=1917219 RepID=UPI0026164245|nr:MgtC/SapB family protein [Fluviicola sp.]MDF3026608.1 MgtC/SapB family protein [Fluviicola sp.]
MDVKFELIIGAKLILALLLGGLVGFEREQNNKFAGVRTFGAIAVAACIFVAIAEHLTDDTSAIARIIAAIATGIGFIGAGLIFRSGNETHGLTTSAALWATAGIGSAVAVNMFITAIVGSGIVFFLLRMNRFKWYKKMIEEGELPDKKEE